MVLSIRWERFSLSAFCGVGGAKWGEGRGEVHRLTVQAGKTSSRIGQISPGDSWFSPYAGSVSPSPRFAESAEQNGERAGVRCIVSPFKQGKPAAGSDKLVRETHGSLHTLGAFLPLRVLRSRRSKMGRGPG